MNAMPLPASPAPYSPWHLVRRILASLLLGIGLVLATLADSEPAFFDVEVEGPIVIEGDAAWGSGVSQARPVLINSALRDLPALSLNLFEGMVLEAVRTRIELSSNGDFVWVGRIEGEPLSEVVFAFRGGFVSARVDRPLVEGNAVYEVHPLTDGWSVLIQVTPESMAGECEPLAPPQTPVSGDIYPPATAENPAVIDVMVVYTPAAQAAAIALPEGIEGQISQAIASANTAYQDSLVHVRLNLVHTALVSYASDGASLSTTLGRLAAPNDSYMDEVPAWRNQYGADLVVLLHPDSFSCGVAYLMGFVDTSFAPYGYSVVVPACISNLSFTHELGHNMGCHHDRANAAGGQGAYPYSYGYQHCIVDKGFRTVMAYPCSTAAVPRVNYLSNPNVTLGGYPTGISHESNPAISAENARTINNTAHTVAAFRTGSLVPPNAPSNLNATAQGSRTIALTWIDLATNEASFHVDRSFDSQAWTQIAVLPPNTVAFPDATMPPATTAYYRVRACNSAGCSAFSNVASATTPLEPPPAPSDLSALATSPESIRLTWLDLATNETRFEILRSPDLAAWSLIATPDLNATQYDDSTVLPSTTYHYRIRACNEAGCSGLSNLASATTPAAPPTAPSGLTATALGIDQVRLDWLDLSTDETGFLVERSLDGVGFMPAISVDADATSALDIGLAAATTYLYQVRAVRGTVVSSPSAVASATTMPLPASPAAPSGLTATVAGSGRVQLNWIDNTGNETGTEIQRSADGLAWSHAGVVTADLTGYVDAGLAPSAGWRHRVRTYNSAGYSDFSDETLAVTGPEGPEIKSVTFTSIKAEDGYLIESSETSNQGGTAKGNATSADAVRMGDDRSDRQFKGLVSFDTSPLPDVGGILSATLRLRLGKLTGTNPFLTHGPCQVDIRGGSGFGGAIALAIGDFQAPADAVGVATLSNPGAVGGWAQGSISGSGLGAIDRTGRTQFRIALNLDDNDDLGADIAGFHSGGAAAGNQPELAVTYEVPLSLPPGPTGLVAKPASRTQIRLSWVDNAFNENGFKIERSRDGVLWQEIAWPGADTMEYVDSGLTEGIVYFFRVRSYNDKGYSPWSNTVSETPGPPPVLLTLTSRGSEDGYLLESSETSNVGGTFKGNATSADALRIGDDKNNAQYKSVISFDASSLPAGVQIRWAKLRVRLGKLTGTSPFLTHGTCRVDLKTGTGFAGSTALAAADFQAPADATGVAVLPDPLSVGGWSEGSLDPSAFAAIAAGGRLQFRLAHVLDDNNDKGADIAGFYSGAGPAGSRPELVIEYVVP